MYIVQSDIIDQIPTTQSQLMLGDAYMNILEVISLWCRAQTHNTLQESSVFFYFSLSLFFSFRLLPLPLPGVSSSSIVSTPYSPTSRSRSMSKRWKRTRKIITSCVKWARRWSRRTFMSAPSPSTRRRSRPANTMWSSATIWLICFSSWNGWNNQRRQLTRPCSRSTGNVCLVKRCGTFFSLNLIIFWFCFCLPLGCCRFGARWKRFGAIHAKN